MPPLTGPYVFTIVAQLLAIALYLVALRPDPLLLAQRMIATAPRRTRACGDREPDRPRVARYAIFAVAGGARRDGRGDGDDAGAPAAPGRDADDHRPDDQPARRGDVRAVAGLRHPRRPLGRIPTILSARRCWRPRSSRRHSVRNRRSAVTVALVLLGLGWSASTVAGSALLTEASPGLRTRRQGRSDSTMSLVAALGAILAG